MGQTTEDYLDSLLRQAMGIEEPKPAASVEEEVVYNDENVTAENLEQSFGDAIENISIGDSLINEIDNSNLIEPVMDITEGDKPEMPIDVNTDTVAIEPIESTPEQIVEDESEQAVEIEEPVKTMSIDDLDPADANKALDPDMIAALFASANAEDNNQVEAEPDLGIETELEPELGQTEVDEVTEQIAEEDSEQVAEIEEPVKTMSIDDLDPADANKALDPDMIAALFASANAEDNNQVEAEPDLGIETELEPELGQTEVDEGTEQITEEESEQVAEIEEPVKTMSIDDLDPADANKALDPDMIAALFAGANENSSESDVDEETSADNQEETDLTALLDNLDNLDNMIDQEEKSADSSLEYNGMDLGDVDLSAMLDDVTKSVDEDRLANTDDLSAEDLNALLNSLDGDEDISEIGSMLKKDENEELLDPDAMSLNALLNNDEDIVPALDEEEDKKGKKKKKKKEKKEKKKLFGKKNKATDDFAGLGEDGEEIALDIDLDSLPDISEEKKSFLSKVIEKLFEEDEEEQEASLPKKGNVIEESAVDIATEGAVANEEILKQLEEEPEEDKKKKKKDKKKKKGGDDEEGEDSKSKKKKKEKKQKEEEPELPQKKLPLKKVLANIGLILSVAAVFIVIAFFFPYAHDKQMAKKYYKTGDYKEVYEHLRGHKLNEEEQHIYDQAFTVLKVDRQYDSYEKYMKLGFKLEALNALVQGVQVMDDYSTRASELGILDKFEPICQKIVDTLNNVFGVSVDTARAWYQIEGTDEYTRSLYNHIYNMMPRDEQGNLIYYPDEANREIMTVEETDL